MEDVEEDHKWNKHQKVLGQRGNGSQMEELSTPLWWGMSELFFKNLFRDILNSHNESPTAQQQPQPFQQPSKPQPEST
jgi:hypothetical protein